MKGGRCPPPRGGGAAGRAGSLAVPAALAAALIVAAGVPGAGAAEVRIDGIPFACETPGGRIVKPRLGDIGGLSFADLPAQRQQCLDMIESRIAACRDNTGFASEAENRVFAACLPAFERRAGLCAAHFAAERSKCDAGGAVAGAAVSGERPNLLQIQDSVPGDDYPVDPVERLMEVVTAANVRAGPGLRHEVVDIAPAGMRVPVTGEVGGRDWVRVSLPDGRTAFVYAPLLRTVKAEEPTVPPAPGASTVLSLDALGEDWSFTEDRACRVWNHGNRDYEPFTWSGACVDGKAAGEGRLTYRGGEGIYEGTMHAGMMHGHGVLTWSDGFRYEGGLRDGRQHGQGNVEQGQRRALRGRLARRQAARPGHLHRCGRRGLRGRLERRVPRRPRRPSRGAWNERGGVRLRVARASITRTVDDCPNGKSAHAHSMRP